MSNQAEIAKWVKAAREHRRLDRKLGQVDVYSRSSVAMMNARYLKATGERYVIGPKFDLWFYRQGGSRICAGKRKA